MQISSNHAYQTTQTGENQSVAQLQKAQNAQELKEAALGLNATEISNSYFMQFQTQAFSQASSGITAQSAIGAIFDANRANVPQNLNEILSGIDYAAIGYGGRPIGELNSQEAGELVGQDGFFGVTNTADRIANFIINAADSDLQRLQAGREGMLAGFEQAREIWGGNLPEISEQTISLATRSIDQKIAEAGGNILNVSA